MTRNGFRGTSLLGSGLITAVCLALASPASAAINFPDITTGGVIVTYNAATDEFHATIPVGDPQTIDQDGVLPTPDHTLFNSFFDVFVTIDSSGNATAGTLSIGGNYDSSGGPSVSLQSSSLSSFSYDLSGLGKFEMVFDNVLSTIPGFGSIVHVEITPNFLINPTDFSSNFSNGIDPDVGMAIGTADTANLPEPTSMAVWLLASAGAVVVGRRRSRKVG